MPKIVVTLSDGSEVTHELTEDTITIGRLSDNLIQIEEASVSSHHAQLTLIGGDYHLKDLNSTNGTRVNGQQITESQLQDGDRIRIGKVDSVYASEIPANARPAPEAESMSVTPAESSSRPSDFANASPFKTKKKKKDPVASAVFAFAALAIVVFLAAVGLIFTLHPPQ